jgi:hypothetical protein
VVRRHAQHASRVARSSASAPRRPGGRARCACPAARRRAPTCRSARRTRTGRGRRRRVVRDAEREAGAIEAADESADAAPAAIAPRRKRQGHAVDGRLELGDRRGSDRSGRISSDGRRAARRRSSARARGGHGRESMATAMAPARRGARRGRAFRARSPASRPAAIAWRSATASATPRPAVAPPVAPDEVRRSVTHAVAVDQVVVQAEAEVEQLLGPATSPSRPRVDPAEAEVRRRPPVADAGACRRRGHRLVEESGRDRDRRRRTWSGRGASAPRRSGSCAPECLDTASSRVRRRTDDGCERRDGVQRVRSSTARSSAVMTPWILRRR